MPKTTQKSPHFHAGRAARAELNKATDDPFQHAQNICDFIDGLINGDHDSDADDARVDAAMEAA